jgi:hypothetical protein
MEAIENRLCRSEARRGEPLGELIVDRLGERLEPEWENFMRVTSEEADEAPVDDPEAVTP